MEKIKNSFNGKEKEQISLDVIESTIKSYLSIPFGIYPEFDEKRIKEDIIYLQERFGKGVALEKLIVVSVAKQNWEKGYEFWKKVLGEEKMSLEEIYDKLFDSTIEIRNRIDLAKYLLEHKDERMSVADLISKFGINLIKDAFYLGYLRLVSSTTPLAFVVIEDSGNNNRFCKLTRKGERRMKVDIRLDELKKNKEAGNESKIRRIVTRFEKLILERLFKRR